MREDERRSLAATERQLEAEDPELVRKLREDSPGVTMSSRAKMTAGIAVFSVLTVLCFALGQWFAVMQIFALAGLVLMWWRGWRVST